MKWKTHLWIASWVGSHLNLSNQDISKLSAGSIHPDNWRDRRHHHDPKYTTQRIKRWLLKARGLFLKGKPHFFATGIALHYIQDRLIPGDSYLVHINIEEELNKIVATQQGRTRRFAPTVPHKSHKTSDVMHKAISDLPIAEEEKLLLLDPNYTRGKISTFTLANVNLPDDARRDPKLIFNVACRISIGVVNSIGSQDPPSLLLSEKSKEMGRLLISAKNKFKIFLIMEFCLPLILLYYGKVGGLAYGLITILNLFSLIPCILILKREIPIKIRNYIALRDNSKTLSAFFFLSGLLSLTISVFTHSMLKFSSLGTFLILIAILHIIYPRINIELEIEEEISWYNWNNL